MVLAEQFVEIFVRPAVGVLINTLMQASWIWSPNGRAANRRAVLVWSAATNPYTCRLTAPGSTIIAKFYPVVAMRKRNEPAPLAQLEVFPSGQKHFDDILLSLLVVERKRLTPSSGDFKHLFSR